jgi:hypothetical protein
MHTDRNAAIALSILLFSVLMAIAWYFRLHIKTIRASDLERQQCQDEPMMRRISSAKDTWYRRSSSNATAVTRNGSRKDSIFKLKPIVTRKDSVATCSSEGSHATREKRKWPSLSHWRTQDSGVSTLALPTPISTPCSSPQCSTDPLSSIHACTLPLTSTERPSPTHSRPSSSYTGNSVSDPLSITNPHYRTPPRRHSSLSQTNCDKRWWNEVARRGSTSSTARRLSILEPVLEPEVRGYEYETRMLGKQGRRESWEDSPRAVDDKVERRRGSKCEEEPVMYDWTRPSDVEIQRASEIRYTKVDWNKERERGRRASVPVRVVGRRVEWDECIQELDFALMR